MSLHLPREPLDHHPRLLQQLGQRVCVHIFHQRQEHGSLKNIRPSHGCPNLALLTAKRCNSGRSLVSCCQTSKQSIRSDLLRDERARNCVDGHTVHAIHRIRVSYRLIAGTATTHAGSQTLRVSCCATNDGAPLQNPKPLALPLVTAPRNDVAAASRGFSQPHRSARSTSATG